MRPDLVSISIRKLDPAIAKYLIDNYGAGWPDDVELWEKVPTDGDNRHWIDVLSGKAAKDDEAGDPLVDQFYLTNDPCARRAGNIGVDAIPHVYGDRCISDETGL